MKPVIKYCLFIFLVIASFALTAQELTVPLGGNAWVKSANKNDPAAITDSGLVNWQYKETVISIYIHLNKKGTLSILPKLVAPIGNSVFKITIDGDAKRISFTGNLDPSNFLTWNIKHAGYIKIDLQGISKTGKEFARMKELIIEGDAVNDSTAFVKNNDDNYFYWGRRGPSVHLNYVMPDTTNNIEWFYNEVTVPAGNDVIGSFFMANGFGEGYFGMQVNSDTERRILFSVWSPFETDDPSSIPADKKIVLLKKGNDVQTGEFGNEGSGGQSFLRYNWKVGNTYKFLLRAKPAENNYTTYTAYFFAPEKNEWMLIASFSRPVTATYLKHLHSFLENFEPITGNITRKAYYHNQWIKTNSGEYKPIYKAIFTSDATAKKKFRLDYKGGVEGGKFYLRNAGFFNDNTEMKKSFEIQSSSKAPEINFKLIEAL